MYHLTLTAGERKAIDWIGGRYSHGHDLYRLLYIESENANDADWDTEGDITFDIPEAIAWQIQAIADECENRWDCFAPDLTDKMNQFCSSIV